MFPDEPRMFPDVPGWARMTVPDEPRMVPELYKGNRILRMPSVPNSTPKSPGRVTVHPGRLPDDSRTSPGWVPDGSRMAQPGVSLGRDSDALNILIHPDPSPAKDKPGSPRTYQG